jgi:Ca2+-binding RTX toxin-like protein
METRCQGWLAVTVAALTLGAFAPAAGAATAHVTDDGTEQVLHYDAVAGEVNNIWIEGGPQYQIIELAPAGGTATPITVGAGCVAYANTAEGVSCGSGDVDRIEIDLGDKDDTLDIANADVPITADGGEGADTFHDMEATHVAGGHFARLFKGGPGNDFFNSGQFAEMPTEYQGGDGTDFISYTYRDLQATPVGQNITLDDKADDGQGTEGDNVHSDIEYVFGTDKADTIKGSDGDNYIVGNGGADTIDGMGGKDSLFAGDAASAAGDTCDADVLNGGDGDDDLWLGGATTADGGADNDRLLSDQALCPGKSDVASGGTGEDSADFWGVTTPGLSVSLDDVANDGLGGTDNYKSDIERLQGPETVGMTLIGSSGPNHITGGGGNDLIDGAGGADQMSGGKGIDTVDYSSRTAPVTVTIGEGDEDGETGEGDGVVGDIENVRGGSGADTIVGNELDNVIDGGLGADMISGGAGLDAVDYSRRTARVSVTLAGGAADDGEAGEHDNVASDVEGAFGGAGADVLVGNAANGFLKGLGGNDDISDPGGTDTLDSGPGDDKINSVDGFADTVICSTGTDTVTSEALDILDASCKPPAPGPDPDPNPNPNPKPQPKPTPKPQPKPTPKPIDLTAPNAAVGVAKVQTLAKWLSSGLKVKVKSNEGGTISAVLTPESSKRVLATGKGKASAGVRKTLTLTLTKRGRKALRHLHSHKFKLVVTVTDAAGNKRIVTTHMRVKS